MTGWSLCDINEATRGLRGFKVCSYEGKDDRTDTQTATIAAAQLHPPALRQQSQWIIPALISQDYCEALLGFIWQPRLTLTRHKAQHDRLKKHKKECLVLQTDPRQQARKLLLQVSNPKASLTKHLTYKKSQTLVLKASDCTSDFMFPKIIPHALYLGI